MLHRFAKRPDFLYPKLPSRTAGEVVVEGLSVGAAAAAVVAVDGVMGGGGGDEGEEATAVEDVAVYGGLVGEAGDGSELWKRASLGSVGTVVWPRDSDHCEGRPWMDVFVRSKNGKIGRDWRYGKVS